MSLLEKYERFVGLWRVALPHVIEPTIQDAGRWTEYRPAIVERAILRTGRRFAPDRITPGLTPEESYRYTSAVARALTEHPHRPAHSAN